MRLDQIKWTPHGKTGTGQPVDITKVVYDAKRNHYAIMRTSLRHPTHVPYEYTVYVGGHTVLATDIHAFLLTVLPFDPKDMSPLEIKCWLMDNSEGGAS